MKTGEFSGIMSRSIKDYATVWDGARKVRRTGTSKFDRPRIFFIPPVSGIKKNKAFLEFFSFSKSPVFIKRQSTFFSEFNGQVERYSVYFSVSIISSRNGWPD